MKKVLVFFLLINTWLLSGELVWQQDVPTAVAKAKAEQKNIVLIVEATYCKWCKKLKRETLSDAQVIRRLQNYVLVKVRRCDKEAMKILPSQHYAAPTTFFMTPELETIEKAIGYFNAQDFLSYINDVESE
ncbi:MAG TPA: thioredoxin family protein [Epsilonproteobacteria bacterium]|nr:thioredoxin family protein [Campylobacterota bacterium]